jgi:hypothetical protein
MKEVLFFIVVLCWTTFSLGQNSEEFGSVSVNELSNQSYAGDTAAAVILFDIGSLKLEPNAVAGSTLKRHMRIKILKRQALSYWGSHKISIHKAGDLKIKGITYNLEDGVIRKSELDETSVMRTNLDKDTELVSVAFPNVKEGSIVEFITVSKHPDYYVPRWQFQYPVPTKKSEYSVNVPVKKYKYNLKGFLTPDVHEEKYEGKYHRWVMTNIPAFAEEPMMGDTDAYVSQLDFSFGYEGWGDVYYRLADDKSFGQILHQYKFLKDIVDEVTAGMADDRQKIKSISNYVKNLIHYNGGYAYLGISPNEVIDKKKGDSGDINLLLGSMLEKAGFTVNMILLSTRKHGVIDQKLPSLSHFNYVVCEVTTKDGEILLDATDKLLPFDMLPPRCYNQVGFLIGKSQYGWVPIQPKQRSKILMDATVTFTEAGGLTGKLKVFRDGYAAYDLRSKYRDGGESDYKLDLGNSLWNIQNYENKNLQNIEKPIEEICDVSIDEYVTQANDRIYFNPHLFLREEVNPFSSDLRMYPVDFEQLTDNTVVCNLVIPDGYVVEELPENKAISLAGNAAKCTFSTSVNGNKIMVMSKLIFNKTFFLPTEYAGLKEFYGKIVAKKAESIVLKKQQ